MAVAIQKNIGRKQRDQEIVHVIDNGENRVIKKIVHVINNGEVKRKEKTA